MISFFQCKHGKQSEWIIIQRNVKIVKQASDEMFTSK